jgi:NAD(P)-dependent dehydrogenase (short-subunit alcohol dehydrogenase family)
MTLDLTGKRVVVTGGKHFVGQAIAEAVAREESRRSDLAAKVQ